MVFDVGMTVGTETARFLIHADLHVGNHHIVFLSATRTTSQEPIVDASPVSWGRLKAAYLLRGRPRGVHSPARVPGRTTHETP